MRELYVDSRRANSNNVFTLYVTNPLTHVTSAEITALTVSPDSTIIQRGDILFLDIEELRRPCGTDCLSNVTAPQTPVSTAFGMIHLKDYSVGDDEVGATAKYYSDKKDHIHVDYLRPIPSVDRLTVRWRDFSGNLVPMDDYNLFVLRFNCDD